MRASPGADGILPGLIPIAVVCRIRPTGVDAAHLAIFVTGVFRRVKNLSLAGFLHVLPTATDRAGPDALATLSVASMQWPRIDDNMIVVDPGALHRRDRWFP